MTEDARTENRRIGEIVVDSDWGTTLEVATLFIICALLLMSEIRKFIWGHFAIPKPFHPSFFAIFNEVFEIVVVVYLFMFAFKAQTIALKFAFVLIGIPFVSARMLSFIHSSPPTYHAVAISNSVMRQIALTIFCVAIAEWFRSVVRWDQPSDSQRGQS